MEAATKPADASVVSRPRSSPDALATLPRVLEQHDEWLASGGDAGKQADLSGADLTGAELTDANLRDALLIKTRLNDADLMLADFEGASLLEADLRRANLLGARFYAAGLQGARLEGATGLLSGQLAGANLLGAVLPEPDCAMETLGHVTELARKAGRLLAGLLLFDALASLRIVTVGDAPLIQNASCLPVHGTRAVLPLVGFFLFTPILLLGLYILLHFYMQRLWQGAAALPAILSDGRSLDACLPWFARWSVRMGFRYLRGPQSPLAWMERAAAKVLLYWIVPASLLLFWARYLTLEDLRGSMLQILLTAAGIAAALYFPAAARGAFSGDALLPAASPALAMKERIRRHAAAPLAAVLLLTLLSVGIIFGAPYLGRQTRGPAAIGPSTWAAGIFWLAGYSPYPRLNEAVLSVRPSGWSGRDADLSAVQGADLEGLRLRYLQAFGSFFARARLWRADLRHSDLTGADLRGADLRQADLRGAVLDQARLRGAVLQGAGLQQADLNQADLRDANLSYASLAASTLLDAHLAGAVLYGADLQNAMLMRADLGQADLREADLRGADLGMTNLRQTYLTSAKLDGAHLENAQLDAAILDGADLRQANLSQADLQGTVLRGANLAGADLRGVTGATAEQICSASDLRGVQMDDALAQLVAAQCGSHGSVPFPAPPPSVRQPLPDAPAHPSGN